MMNSPAPEAKWRSRSRRVRRVVAWAVFSLALAFGAMTFAQAWSMTHYEPATACTTRIADVAGWEKLRLLLCGPTIRRQSNTKSPRDIGADYETVRIKGYDGLQLEGWRLVDRAEGGAPIVVMIPGYGASKDTLLPAAREFMARGFAIWMFDPHGIGGSEGRVTSLGFHEAEDVAAAYREVRRANPKGRIVLYGPSMGAVAILRAISMGWVQPDALILECPFDRFTHTIGNRIAWIGMPRFPFAQAVALWAGVQQGFNGLAHNPVIYAERVQCPTLLLQGDQDQSVGPPFVRNVAKHLGPDARFELIAGAGHAFLVTRAATVWSRSVDEFLRSAAPVL